MLIICLLGAYKALIGACKTTVKESVPLYFFYNSRALMRDEELCEDDGKLSIVAQCQIPPFFFILTIPFTDIGSSRELSHFYFN